MPFAPQQDWDAYRALAAPHDLAHAQSLTPQQKFALYEDLHRLVHEHRMTAPNRERLDEIRWEQKLLQRAKFSRIYSIADGHGRG